MALTTYPEGSIRELWKISFPLMLSSLSIMLMLFVDRLMLAQYSTQALNAVVNAATFGWAFVFMGMILAGISEVFVAQYNGARKKEKLGEPVWQMIWLGIGTILFFFPMAFWGKDLFYGTPERALERAYFFWMMLFGPSIALYGALCGFFIGQGKTALITAITVGANLVNAVLDYLLIFGVEGWLPSLGIEGAAIATTGTAIFQVIVLGAIFLNKTNRELHRTNNFSFNAKSFWQCLRVGFPGAVFVGIEVLGWATFYWMMSLVGEKHMTLSAVCQSVVILFYFFGEGINKGAATIAGNLIGAQRNFIVSKVMRAGIILHLLFFLTIFAFLYGYCDWFIDQFLGASQNNFAFRPSLRACLFLTLYFLLFEGIRLLFSGLLTAAGDIFFLLVAGSASVWAMLVLPVYLTIVKGGAEIEVAMFIWAIYGFGASLIYFWRFYGGKWKAISLVN